MMLLISVTPKEYDISLQYIPICFKLDGILLLMTSFTATEFLTKEIKRLHPFPAVKVKEMHSVLNLSC